MRSIALQGFVGLMLATAVTGCAPSLQSQCQKYCQYLFLTCNAGPITQTEASCNATCAEPSPTVNGGTCANPAAFFNCVLDDQCSQLQGPSGADALVGCALEASCTLAVNGGNNGGNNGNNNNGGGTTGNGNNNGGSTNGNNNNGGGTTNGNNNGGGTTNGNNNNGGSTNGGLISSGSSSGGRGSTNSSTGGVNAGGTSGGTVPTIGMTCVPPAAAGDLDPCAADNAGLACNLNADGVTYGCSLPSEFEPCLANVGCGTSPVGMSCLTLTSVFTTPVCVNTCTTSAGCPDELTNCVSAGGTNFCYYDYCGVSSAGPDGGITNGTTYYAPCNNAATDDGLCLPFVGTTGTIGICQSAGTMAANATGCAQYRSTASGTTNQCVLGTTCLSVGTATFCSPLCGYTAPLAADGGPGCPSLETCENLGTSVNFGGCIETCTTGTTVCPTGYTCQVQSGTSGLCLP